MALLDELRRAVAARHDQDKAGELNHDESVATIDRCARRAFDYLNDYATQLNILKPPCPRSFEIQGVGALENLTLANFYVNYRRTRVQDREVMDHAYILYRAVSDRVLRVTKERELVARYRDFLGQYGVRFDFEEIKNEQAILTHGRFTIDGSLTCEFSLRADYGRGRLIGTYRNIDQLGTYSVAYKPTEVDDIFLEEVGKLILGRPSRIRIWGEPFLEISYGARV